MKHQRHYTLEEANAALDWVGETIEQLRVARDALQGFSAEDLLSDQPRLAVEGQLPFLLLSKQRLPADLLEVLTDRILGVG